MNQNVGVIDRTIRALLAVMIIVMYSMGQISGWAALILGMMAVYFIYNSYTGTCPVCKVMGISTKGKLTIGAK